MRSIRRLFTLHHVDRDGQLVAANRLGGLLGIGGRGDELPAPLARKYRLALDHIEWTALGPGIWQHKLALSPGAKGELNLLKLTPGRRLPLHGHGGTELTVVLTGAFSDSTGEYRRGDVQEVDASVEHQPVGDRNEGCICLVAAEGPYLLKS